MAAIKYVFAKDAADLDKIQGKAIKEEDQAKINVEVNDATIQAVLSLCNFEAIINV